MDSQKKDPLYKSFGYAFEGIGTCIKKERNMKIHCAAAILVVIAGVILKISSLEWCICLTLFGLIMALELVNTAVEAVVDLVTEERQFGFSRYFKLPFFYGRMRMREYRLVKKRYSPAEAAARMQEQMEKNMEKIQEKGVQIFENDVKIETDEKSCSARGQFTLIQRTGKRVERTRTDS